MSLGGVAARSALCFFQRQTVQVALKAKRMQRAMLRPQMAFISKQVVLEAPAQTQ